jgi:hypothetical protein
MYCVQIFKDDNMKEIKIKGNDILKTLTKISSNNENICELYKWEYENITTKCYGSYDGTCGFENKHELPPNGVSIFLEEDSSEKLLFGDIFIVRFKDDKLVNTTIADYGEFYNLIFNGFDGCISEDEDLYSSEEEYLDEASDTEEEFEILSNSSDNNDLNTDFNNY